MDSIWGNLSALAGRFTISDNFYINAEISSLGHAWVTYGRSSDYNERTWAMACYVAGGSGFSAITPFDHLPRSWPLACGGGASGTEAKKTQSWDISHVDGSPGLDAQVGRWMRGRQIQARDDDDWSS